MLVTARPAIAYTLALAALIGAAACGDKSPTAPSSSSPVPYTLTVSGTLSLHRPGDAGQLTATAWLEGGQTKDVTRDAMWSCNCQVKVSAGLVTATGYGQGDLAVIYQTLRQSIPVRVAPDGTFLIEGTVTNASQSNVADVEATSASGTYTTTSDASGTFVVPAAGATTLRVSMSGYDTAVRQVTVNQDDQVTVELQQRSLPPQRPFSGRYTLTFVASPSCAPYDLPAEAMQRTYGAYVYDAKAVREEPWDMDVLLDGATFAVRDGDPGFIGTLDRNTVRFLVGDDPSGYYTFIERVGSMYMSYEGTATGTVTDRAILTTFNGRVVLSSTPGYAGFDGWECNATDHRLDFVR